MSSHPIEVAMRLVQIQDGMFGVAKVSGTSGSLSVKDICSEFTLLDEDKVPQSSGDLFFYGSFRDYQGNFRSPEQANSKISDFLRHKERKRADYSGGPINELEAWVSRMPIEQTGIQPERIVVVKRALAHAYEGFSKEAMETVELSKSNPGSARKTMSMMRLHFPDSFTNLVDKSRRYFKFERTLSKVF